MAEVDWRPIKKRDREGVLVTEILLPVGATYESSDRMTFNNAQETAPLASMEDQGDDVDGIVLILMSMRMKLGRICNGIIIAYKSPVVEVRLRFKLSTIIVLNMMLRNNLTFLMLRPLLKTGSLPYLRMSSSRTSSPRQSSFP